MSSTPNTRPRWRSIRILEAGVTLLLASALVALGVHGRTGDHGIVRVADDQVAVVVDRLDGSNRVVQRPGYVLFVPLLHKVHLLDRSPRVLRMEGSRADGRDRVPQLFARAKDGSSFWFKEVELQYALVPEMAAFVLDDTGSAVPKPELLCAAARSILRDELGRFTSEEVARGECIQPVKRAAVTGLNAVLRPHGIEVLGISLGKPAFDEAYEDAIRRRATFAQEIEELESRRARLEKERAQREAGVRKDKEVELLKLEGTLVHDRGAARSEDIRVRQNADDFFRAQEQSGRATQAEKESQAALLKARYVAAARGVYREALDLERSGILSVRAALVRKLSGIQLDLVPYSRDPAPHRVEYEIPSASPAGISAGFKPKP